MDLIAAAFGLAITAIWLMRRENMKTPGPIGTKLAAKPGPRRRLPSMEMVGFLTPSGIQKIYVIGGKVYMLSTFGMGVTLRN
jgi:hypothetical protein